MVKSREIENIVDIVADDIHIPTLILIGASGCGKDTVQKALVNRGICERVVTYTTRPKRVGEVDGIDYHFVTKEEFKKLNLVESREYHTLVNGEPDVWYYGSQVTKSTDKIPCIILTPDGAKNWKKQEEDAFVVYIDVPSDIRKERAMKRGSFDEQEWSRREMTDRFDFSAKNLYDQLADDYVSINGAKSVDEVVTDIINSRRYWTISKMEKELDCLEP